MSRGTTLTHLSELFTQRPTHSISLINLVTFKKPYTTHTELLDLLQISPSCPFALALTSSRPSLARRCRCKDGRRERADEVRLERL